MATSNFPTTQYTAEQFVESCGAILFDLTQEPKRVCLLHYLKKNEWIIAKGRRNCGESRLEAARREVEEETGYKCHIHPVTMSTRAPGIMESAHVVDQARSYTDITEPFMLTIRELEAKSEVKLIWWYIAAVDEDPRASISVPLAESGFNGQFFTFDEALQKLSFQTDRDVLERAISIIENS